VHRHGVSGTDVTVLSQRLPLRVAKRWLRRGQGERCRCSSNREELGALELAPGRSRERQRHGACCRHELGDRQAPQRPPQRHQGCTRVHAEAQLAAERQPRLETPRRRASRVWREARLLPSRAASPASVFARVSVAKPVCVRKRSRGAGAAGPSAWPLVRRPVLWRGHRSDEMRSSRYPPAVSEPRQSSGTSCVPRPARAAQESLARVTNTSSCRSVRGKLACAALVVRLDQAAHAGSLPVTWLRSSTGKNPLSMSK